ncbi:MAG: hypothetical protein U5N86_12295 [Planctomycetota bacterium]|nr:hypothetical protein [Planctomycetota bacterium]
MELRTLFTSILLVTLMVCGGCDEGNQEPPEDIQEPLPEITLRHEGTVVWEVPISSLSANEYYSYYVVPKFGDEIHCIGTGSSEGDDRGYRLQCITVNAEDTTNQTSRSFECSDHALIGSVLILKQTTGKIAAYSFTKKRVLWEIDSKSCEMIANIPVSHKDATTAALFDDEEERIRFILLADGSVLCEKVLNLAEDLEAIAKLPMLSKEFFYPGTFALGTKTLTLLYEHSGRENDNPHIDTSQILVTNSVDRSGSFIDRRPTTPGEISRHRIRCF